MKKYFLKLFIIHFQIYVRTKFPFNFVNQINFNV